MCIYEKRLINGIEGRITSGHPAFNAIAAISAVARKMSEGAQDNKSGNISATRRVKMYDQVSPGIHSVSLKKVSPPPLIKLAMPFFNQCNRIRILI
jgi:hypothetical protein